MPEFRVTVYEIPCQYPVEAESSEEAKEKVINRYWGGDYSEIKRVTAKKVK